MAKARVKPIHLIVQFGYRCRAVCDHFCSLVPIETIIINYIPYSASKGTFSPKKVTCKRCLKHPDYKEAMDKIKYPLFYLKDGIV